MAETARNLVLLDQANRLLSKASSLEELKEVRDAAETARTFAKVAHLGLELQNRAAELKLRAERKAGAFLTELRLRGGDRRSKSPRVTLKLDELGVTKRQSELWQLAASVPEDDFLKYLHGKTLLGEEVTASGLLRIARSLKRGGITAPSPVARVVRVRGVPTADSRAELLSVVTELKEHCRHLAQILQPLVSGEKADYKPAERRYVARLTDEMEKSIAVLEQQLWQSH